MSRGATPGAAAGPEGREAAGQDFVIMQPSLTSVIIPAYDRAECLPAARPCARADSAAACASPERADL